MLAGFANLLADIQSKVPREICADSADQILWDHLFGVIFARVACCYSFRGDAF